MKIGKHEYLALLLFFAFFLLSCESKSRNHGLYLSMSQLAENELIHLVGRPVARISEDSIVGKQRSLGA
ncbi:MAG: hypothetical protein HOB38_30470 [Deltaproteobacteria bacterium]|jgi:hypothetical protein|nr:hypothetical protein [Deltaproteobacteria bacterium]MBT6616452.1 hypothetical protein [Deltaproteobacteria bacterium]